MSRIPLNPEIAQMHFKRRGLKHRTGLPVKMAEEAGPGLLTPVADSQRASTFGDRNDLYRYTATMERTSSCNFKFVSHYQITQPIEYYEYSLNKASNYFAINVINYTAFHILY